MNPIVEKVYQIGIIPVIAFNSVDEALPLCKALAEGGLPAAEVTFRTACAEECIRKIHEEMPEMLLGAGTVLTCEQADRAMAAGASFIVAPGFDPEVCKHVIDKGGIMMPGTASAGEMQQAMNMGCEALKFFPAEANGGVGMLKNIGAALKGARWMCTGGVNAKNVNDYLAMTRSSLSAAPGCARATSSRPATGQRSPLRARKLLTPCWACTSSTSASTPATRKRLPRSQASSPPC